MHDLFILLSQAVLRQTKMMIFPWVFADSQQKLLSNNSGTVWLIKVLLHKSLQQAIAAAVSVETCSSSWNVEVCTSRQPLMWYFVMRNDHLIPVHSEEYIKLQTISSMLENSLPRVISSYYWIPCDRRCKQLSAIFDRRRYSWLRRERDFETGKLKAMPSFTKKIYSFIVLTENLNKHANLP